MSKKRRGCFHESLPSTGSVFFFSPLRSWRALAHRHRCACLLPATRFNLYPLSNTFTCLSFFFFLTCRKFFNRSKNTKALGCSPARVITFHHHDFCQMRAALSLCLHYPMRSDWQIWHADLTERCCLMQHWSASVPLLASGGLSLPLWALTFAAAKSFFTVWNSLVSKILFL